MQDTDQPDVPHVLKDEATGKFIALLKCNAVPVAFMLTDDPPFVMHYSTRTAAEEAARRIMAGADSPERKTIKYKLLAESPRLSLEVMESPFIGDDELPIG